LLLILCSCGEPGGGIDTASSATSEAHCGTAEGSSVRCGCNNYCQNTNCGLCRSVRSGLVAEPPAASGTNCVDGFAGSYPCHNVDLLAFLPLSTIGGGSGNDVWGWTDSLTGKEYALLGRSTGTSFVDISDPVHPIYLGNLPTHSVNSLWRGIKVYGNHAFIGSEASQHGLQIFDLTRLRSVANPPATFTEDAWYGGFGNSHNIAVNESTGFIFATGTNTCNGGLHIVDVHVPEQPVFAGCVSADGYVHDALCVVYAGPDAAHVGQEICFNSDEDTLTLVDVSVKSAPVQISRTGYPGSGYTHQGWLTEDQRYFLHDDELDEVNYGGNTRTYVWDMADLENPVLLGHFNSSRPAIDHNLFIRDAHAFESNYRAGLRILRFDDLAHAELTEIGYFDIYPADDEPAFNGTWNNFPF
jgi:choice-of-anchor B domain-containing protein